MMILKQKYYDKCKVCKKTLLCFLQILLEHTFRFRNPILHIKIDMFHSKEVFLTFHQNVSLMLRYVEIIMKKLKKKK